MKKLFVGIISMTILTSCNTKQNSELQANKGSEFIQVESSVVKKQSTSKTLNYSGTIVPETTIPLSFQLPGNVTKVYVDEGDKVKEGQLLAEIDKVSYQNAYNMALATKNQAQDAHNRLKQVYDNGSLPEIKWVELLSKLEQANSSAAIAKQNLNNCALRAPISGIIGSRNVEPGSNVMPTSSVLSLLTLKTVYVRISVPENEISTLQKGQEATITIPAIGTQTYTGIIEKLGVTANPISKTYEVKISVPNSDLAIMPGMVCDVCISDLSNHSAIAIPYQSVLKDDNNKPYVYVINASTKEATQQFVKLGSFLGNNICIIDGLNEGDIIITNGYQKINNHAIVTF